MSDKTQKVLMLTPSYDPIIGGTETVVKNLAINLNKIGVQADVMTFNMDRKWEPRWKWDVREEDGFKVYRIPAFNPFRKMPNPIGLFFRLNVIPDPSFKKIIKEYDILHFHDDVDLTFPLFSYFVKKPKVFHCHTLQETFNKYKKNIICKRGFRKSSELYLTVSSNTAKLAKELGANEVKILPNGVDINKFGFNSKNREENLVLFVGRFERRKGIHVLLNSLSLLETPVTLVIVGPHSNDKYSKEVISQIKAENKKEKHNITYLGSVNLDDLVKWLQKASIFVCPSLSESFGVVNVEAMSCGTPVIASNIEGIRDIIESGKNGILVAPNNPVKLAEAIQYLLDNEDIRIKFGKEGRKKVEREFSWDVIAERLCGIYEGRI